MYDELGLARYTSRAAEKQAFTMWGSQASPEAVSSTAVDGL